MSKMRARCCLMYKSTSRTHFWHRHKNLHQRDNKASWIRKILLWFCKIRSKIPAIFITIIPRSVQLAARIKTLIRENHSCIKMHATIWNNPFWWRAFPNACLLYQSVIGTRCEACAIKSEIKSPIIDYRAFLIDILMNSVCRTIIISLSRGNLESECKA